MKFEIFKFKTVTSTNDMAINLIKKEEKTLGCVFATKQTRGRGTHGKKWISEEGNFFGTVFFQLKENYPPFNEFTIITPIIVSDVIKKFCQTKKITLKYPNDIFANGKKICGILQELITKDNKKFLVIGIGINIISNPDINDKYQATNIFFESKKAPTLTEVIRLIVKSYENFFIELNKYNYQVFKQKADSMAVN